MADFIATDNKRLQNLCGVMDENLRYIEKICNVRIIRQQINFHIKPSFDDAKGQSFNKDKVIAILEQIYNQATEEILMEDIQAIAFQVEENSDKDVRSKNINTKYGSLKVRNAKQQHYIEQILSSDLTFGLGPAGTGKTFLAVACAVLALEKNLVKKIIITRPAVEAGERLGFLPGDLAQKIDPYLKPLLDALSDLIGAEKTQKLMEKNIIEVAPLAYMRGRTLNEAFIILDEAQNTTPEQMKMFLTRIGLGAKAVITGDTTQIDLPKSQMSGLVQTLKILKEEKDIAFVYFNDKEVVRHPLVAKIIKAYDKYDEISHK